MKTSEKKWVTVEEACERLGVKRTKLWEMRQSKVLRSLTHLGRVLISVESINRILNRLEPS